MQKIKNLIHHNKDDAAHNNTTVGHHSALDRNGDGINDLTGRPVANNILAPGMTQTTTQTTTAAVNPLDRNGDGILDSRQGLGMNPLDRNGDGILDSRQGLGANRLSQGYGANPLDRNGDGILDSRQGLGMNPLDRNGDGILDSRQGLGMNPLDRNGDGILDAAQGGAYIQSTQRASLVRAEPTIVETIQKDVVIQERIHPVEKEEIQPIIYREREQLDVKQVTQMMHETQIQPTIVQQRELPAERREAIVERGAPIAENIVLPSTQVDATLRTQQIHAPILNETIKKTVIEEIQPVLERDVFVPTIVQNTQPIYEKIVEAPTVYREVREVRELGTRSVELNQPIIAQPMMAREVIAPVVAPVVQPVAVAPITEHVTMSTTTTTTDSFIPAKMMQEGELRNFQPAASNVAPLNTRRV